jgi:hypothetical protein
MTSKTYTIIKRVVHVKVMKHYRKCSVVDEPQAINNHLHNEAYEIDQCDFDSSLLRARNLFDLVNHFRHVLISTKNYWDIEFI